MTTDSDPTRHPSGAAGFAAALSIATIALVACFFALRATTPGAQDAVAPSPIAVELAPPPVASLDREHARVESRSMPVADAPVLLRGRVAGVDPLASSRFRVEVGLGRIDPTDRAEREFLVASGLPTADLHELHSFEPCATLPLAAAGAFEIGVAVAPRYLVVVHDGERLVALERELTDDPARPPGPRILDLGAIEVPPATALEVRLIPSRSSAPLVTGPYALSIARVEPTTAGSQWARALPLVAPKLAQAIFHGERMEIEGMCRIAPLLPDERWSVVVVDRSGLRSRSYEMNVSAGESAELVIPLDDAFPSSELARYRGRLLLVPDRTPIVGATIASEDGNPTRSDVDGRFELIGRRRDHTVVTLRDFDPESPERIEHIEIPPFEGANEPIFEIELLRWLNVTGLSPPAEILVPEPLAYRLEIRRPGHDWRSLAFDRMSRSEDSVRVSVTGGEAEYRLVALWSAVHAQTSGPVVLLASDRWATTAFLAPTDAPCFVHGRIGSESTGTTRWAGIVVEATAPNCGGIPPVAVTCDAEGRFSLGPIRAEQIELVVHLPGGDVVRQIEPKRTPEIEIEVPQSSTPHTRVPRDRNP